jgi:predicted dehydrogenase
MKPDYSFVWKNKSMTPVKTAIIGAGARTIAFCNFITENPDKVKLVALIDTNLEKANYLNELYKLKAQISDTYEDILSSSDIEAVLISTPDHLHVTPAIAALKADKHVYIEKPLATTLEDCDKIIDASEHSTSVCYLGFNMRHSPIHEKICELVRQNKLGKITTIEANEWYYGGKTYFNRWNRFRKFGGGLWLTKACHDFDLITWIAGGRPRNIYAAAALSHYKPIPGAGPRCRDCIIKNTCPDFYDIFKPVEHPYYEKWRQLMLRMPQDGQLAPDICLFNSEKDTFDNGIALIEYENDIRASYTVNVLAARTTRQMRIVGTEGMVEADMETGIVTLTQRHTNAVNVYDIKNEIQGSHGGADDKILSDFFNICRNDGIPRSGLADGRLAVAISLAAQRSSDTGQPIKF